MFIVYFYFWRIMPTQPNTTPPGLWDKKTYLSAAASILATAAVAVSVCAFKGESLALGPSPSVSGSDSHSATSTGLCLAGGDRALRNR